MWWSHNALPQAKRDVGIPAKDVNLLSRHGWPKDQTRVGASEGPHGRGGAVRHAGEWSLNAAKPLLLSHNVVGLLSPALTSVLEGR